MGRESRQSPLLISCGILKPEIEALIEGKKILAEAIFLNKYLHMDYQKLQDALKSSLRKHSEEKPVVIYGDLCLGFNNEMNALMAEYDIVKVDALNCIDCLLGERELSENDAAYIPGNEPHIVTKPLKKHSIGIDIFVPRRSFDFWLKRKNP
jgi:Protein of unknown function (DUF1638)